jgi:1,4-alpha-glucan branching enzyme
MDTLAPLGLGDDDIERIVESRHDAPERVLGPHAEAEVTRVRAFLPLADRVYLRVPREPPLDHVMVRIHPAGLYEARVPSADAHDYQLLAVAADGTVRRRRDAYAFAAPAFDVEDERLFAAGRHETLFDIFGSHPVSVDGTGGARFAVWAPAAQRVSVVGTFNDWDGRCHPMIRSGKAGVWALFVPGVAAGALYKYEIKTPDGAIFLKPDPFARLAEPPPGSASIVADLGAPADPPAPAEAPLPPLSPKAWEPGRALATEDLARLKQASVSHVEFAEAPAGGPVDAGPLVRGAAGGEPGPLAASIAACHAAGLGVVLPSLGSRILAGEALAWFDGTPLYEAEAAATAGELTLDLQRGEILSIIRSAARYWRRQFGADAISMERTLAVALGVGGSDPAEGAWIVVDDDDAAAATPDEALAAIVSGQAREPHLLLGPHHDQKGDAVVRVLAPEAEQVHVVLDDAAHVAYRARPVAAAPGLFEARLDAPVTSRYRLHLVAAGRPALAMRDAYAFGERGFAFSALDEHLFAAGNHYRIFERLGAHRRDVDGVAGTGFAVWAPNAQAVSVVGPFNGWDERTYQMSRRGVGVWEVFVPDLELGTLYKYSVLAADGARRLKTDPYAFATEVPPATASVVASVEGVHAWRDQAWMRRRSERQAWREPVAIYEVHLGSWRRGAGNTGSSYRELARTLVPYVKEMGFTHIELLPIAEHPYEPSWGYQVSNFYAPTARLGGPADLMAFVDACHEAGIGVILDWVPGHFPKDEYALAKFDGTCLYEHADPRKGEHRDWGTLIFNYGRHEVENFLIANALFWLETYHFDGLRVDAVASMLYLDYSRPDPGDWIPNVYGGRENLEAIEFLKHTNVVVHQHFPGVLMIAEESTAWPGVSAPADRGGLGFGFKWNMGWMHDVLHYMSTPTEERRRHHHKLTFSIVYAFNENFILALSHDEVVHLKGSLLARMPGCDWERFANLRLLFAFMYAHPGKKLLFMGGEFGQPGEWSHAGTLDWPCLDRDPHRRLAAYVRDLNALYRAETPMHEVDGKHVGFDWIDPDNAEDSVVAFLRMGRDPRRALLFVLNFSAVSWPNYRIGVPYPVSYRTVFASNDEPYGGAGRAPGGAVEAEEVGWHGRSFSIRLNLPALSAMVLRPDRAA